MTSHNRCVSCNTLEQEVTHFVRRHVDLRPYLETDTETLRISGERSAAVVTQSVGLATCTPDVEAVAVIRIVWRADQMHTVSPTSSRHRPVLKYDALDPGDEGGQHHTMKRRSRHRPVLKYDALDPGDEGGQHHTMKRRHTTNHAIFDRSTCSMS